MTMIRKPTRAQLAEFIPNQQTILAFEQLFDAFNALPVLILGSTVADSTAIANTTTPTNFSQTQVLLANSLVPGKTLRFKMRAVYSTTGTPSYKLRVLLGTTVILDTTAGWSLDTNATDRGLTAIGEITGRTAGAAGTVVAGMAVSEGYGVFKGDHITAAPVTVDTTVDQPLTFEWTWSAASASNTVKIRQLIVEALN